MSLGGNVWRTAKFVKNQPVIEKNLLGTVSVRSMPSILYVRTSINGEERDRIINTSPITKSIRGTYSLAVHQLLMRLLRLIGMPMIKLPATVNDAKTMAKMG